MKKRELFNELMRDMKTAIAMADVGNDENTNIAMENAILSAERLCKFLGVKIPRKRWWEFWK
jgi:hypothetical protein